MKRGEVYFVDLGENVGSEENKIRPVVVIQSNAYNFNSPVFTVAVISSSDLTIPDIQIPITGAYPYTDGSGIRKNLCGAIDLGQIKTVGKERIVSKKVCTLKEEMPEIDHKLLNILGLSSIIKKKENLINSLNGKTEYLKQQLSEKNKNLTWQMIMLYYFHTVMIGLATDRYILFSYGGSGGPPASPCFYAGANFFPE